MSSNEADILSNKGHETFEPAFESDQVPRIRVPNVPEDSQGLSARELAQVPTLDEPEADRFMKSSPLLAKGWLRSVKSVKAQLTKG